MKNSIELQFYNTSHLVDLCSYSLNKKQLHFSALPVKALTKITERKIINAYPISILHQNTAIGFFVLDEGEDKFEFTSNSNALLLRSLSINPKFQGKGYGKQAMILLDKFVSTHFSHITELCLSVNIKNESAHQLYLDVGFIDMEKLKQGNYGPQYMMHKFI